MLLHIAQLFCAVPSTPNAVAATTSFHPEGNERVDLLWTTLNDLDVDCDV
jgi:hypothetical protein